MAKPKVPVRKPLALTYKEGKFAKVPMKIQKGKYGPMTNKFVPK